MQSLLFWLLLLATVECQFCIPGSKEFSHVFGGLCNKSFADANAVRNRGIVSIESDTENRKQTGFYSFNPYEQQLAKPNLNLHTENVTWAHTLYVGDFNIEASIWLNTGYIWLNIRQPESIPLTLANFRNQWRKLHQRLEARV
jgi:hypothetical protein